MAKIYCCVYNGIGNQLFGYALGMYFSKIYQKELNIDLTKLNLINLLSAIGVKKDTRRKYELHKIGFIHPIKKFNLIEVSRNFKFLRNKKYVIADYRRSHKKLGAVNMNQHIYSIGWGDFNILKEVLPDMRAKFSANFEITQKIKEAKKMILETNSIAVHVRRTDFLDPKINKNSIGICSDVYYQNAIKHIKEVVNNPFFIFFSDDIEYVKENMNTENSYVVSGNKGYEDLYLMSLCKHFILANSTFSFWAAFLNDVKDKIVCVPEYWYKTPLRQADYIPDEWKKIAIK